MPSFYCHCCSHHVDAMINGSTHELDCATCGGSCVEVSGQGIDTFLWPDLPPLVPQDSQPQSPQSESQQPAETTAANPHAPLLHQILNRVLGMDVQVGPAVNTSLLSVLQTLPAGVPVGIVVSQPASFRQIDVLSSLLGGQQGGSAGAMEMLGAEALAFEDILHRIFMSEVSHAGAPPASEQCINRLARTKVASAAEAEALGGTCCGISHEPFETGDVVVSLACKHSYIEDNIVTWLRAHNTCPVCRFQVVESSTAPTATVTAASTQD